MESIILGRFNATLNKFLFEYETNNKFDIRTFDRALTLADTAGSYLPERINALIDEYNNDKTENRDEIETARRLIAVLEEHEYVIQILEKGEDPQSHDPVFSLESSGRQRVLTICCEMKKIVDESEQFDEQHKSRMIHRIAAVEKEIYKPKGNFDVILGGLNDFGEALGKFGKDVKPLVERMKEIASITRRNTDEYKGLPSPEETKRLPPPDEASQQE